MALKRPWLWLLLLPIAIHWPDLTGWLSENPIYLESGLTRDWRPNGVLPGLPGWIDGNAGVTLQALGRLVAHDWKAGIVPWWNPYSGLGMPLAGEMQPAAFFLPFVLLLGLSGGVLVLKISLQIVAGLSMWGLLRQLGLCRAAALVGAILFELNGTFAWDSDSSSLPVAFLPLFLLGIERALTAARAGTPGGWRLMSVAIAYSILAGFPETAFIDGLLAFGWAGLRLVQAHGIRAGFAARIACGGIVALLLCAPLLLAFVSFLGQSDQGLRDLSHAALHPGDFAMFLFPYLYGPIFFNSLFDMWYRIGGYVGVPVLLLALAALVGAISGQTRERGLRCLLAAWIILCLVRAGGMPGVGEVWNAIPFISQSIFYRYAAPSWECAAILLAAFALDDFLAGGALLRRRIFVAGTACAALCLLALVAGRPVWRDLGSVPDWRIWFYLAVSWAAASATCIVVAWMAGRRGRLALFAVLALDAVVQFSIPLLAGTRGAAQDIDLGPIGFLKTNLGLNRVFSLGPLTSNYGAFYQVPEINHIYAPVPRDWVAYIRANLDPNADPVTYNGSTPAPQPGVETRPEALRHRMHAYEAIGVKYVLSRKGADPLLLAQKTIATNTPRLVFRGRFTDIFELPNPAPYFEANGCTLSEMTRQSLHAYCPTPATLLRRELHFFGWRAEVNGVSVAVQAESIFQKIDLPAGDSTIRYSFVPPGILWATAASLAGAALLASSLVRRKRAAAQAPTFSL